MIVCSKCKQTPEQKEANLANHHIVPKVLGGTDKDGRLWLCHQKKGNQCHDKLHLFLSNNKELKELLHRLTNEWLQKKGELDDIDTEPVKEGKV